MTWLMVFGSCVFPAAGRNNKSARRSDETLEKSDGSPSANNAFDLVQCGIPAQHKVIVHHQTLPDSHK